MGQQTTHVSQWYKNSESGCVGMPWRHNNKGECEAHCIPRPNKNNSNVYSVLAGPTFLCGFGIIHPINANNLFMVETRTNLDLLRIASRLVQRLMYFNQD